MDLYSMYLPDALSYTSFRSVVSYRDYEAQPIDNKWRTCEYKERQTKHLQQAHSHGNQSASKQQQRKESCPFCKEEKRRPLGAYMRSKGNTNHQDIIAEEENDQEGTEDKEMDQERSEKK